MRFVCGKKTQRGFVWSGYLCVLSTFCQDLKGVSQHKLGFCWLIWMYIIAALYPECIIASRMHRSWFWTHKIWVSVSIWMQIVQNQSIGVQLVDFKNWFQIWRMKYKRWHPSRFKKCIQMQIRCVNCREDMILTSLIGAFQSTFLG